MSKRTLGPYLLCDFRDSDCLLGSKLPCKGQVLRRFLTRHHDETRTVNECARLVIRECYEFWEKARIPVQDERRAIAKLTKLHKEWTGLKKNKARKESPGQKNREQDFMCKLKDLFDVAHQNALEMITIEEDKYFLIAQRKKGRPGGLTGVDKKLFKKEVRFAERNSRMQTRKAQEHSQIRRVFDKAQLTSTSESESKSDSDSSVRITRRRANRHDKKVPVVDQTVAMALDRTGVSTEKSMRIISATAQSLGHNLDNLAVNSTTIWRKRKLEREKLAKQVKQDFDPSGYLVVYWDGKRMKDNTAGSSSRVPEDHLPVVVSGSKPDQILGIPKVTGTGGSEADAVFALLKEWRLNTVIKGFCFDTTSSNTGPHSGACVLLEKLLQRPCLNFACRHHVLEVIISAVYLKAMGPSTGPTITIFENFRRQWPKIDSSKYRPGIADPVVQKAVGETSEKVV